MSKQFRPVLSETELLYLTELLEQNKSHPIGSKLHVKLLTFVVKIQHQLVKESYIKNPTVSVESSLGFETVNVEERQYLIQKRIQSTPETLRTDEDWFNLLGPLDSRTEEEQTKYEEVSLKLYGMIL